MITLDTATGGSARAYLVDLSRGQRSGDRGVHGTIASIACIFMRPSRPGNVFLCRISRSWKAYGRSGCQISRLRPAPPERQRVWPRSVGPCWSARIRHYCPPALGLPVLVRQVVEDPHVGLDVGADVVAGGYQHRRQRSRHDHLAIAVKGQACPGAPLLQGSLDRAGKST